MTRVLVTDAQERSLLAAIRCLSLSGAEVDVAAPSRLAPGLWSRAARRRHVVTEPADSVAEFVDDLEQLVRARRYDLLLAGTDTSLLAVSRHRDRLEPHVHLRLPEHEVVELALTRTAVSAAGRAAGLPPPDEMLCDGPEAALTAARAFGYPVIVKPAEVVAESAPGTARRRAARIARDPDELAGHAARFGPCIVQRRLEANPISLGGVASDDGLVAYALSRYERVWPVAAGSACFSTTLTAPAELIERAERLLSELRWTGLFELELIEDGAGGYCALDFNPRPYGSMALAARAGVPLASIWCEWALGRTPPRRTARPGVGYRWEDADLRHALWQVRNGDRRAAIAAARPRRDVAHAYFSARDPLPAVARTLELLVRAQEKVRGGS